MNRVSVLLPTRGRPGNVRRVVESARATADLPPDFVFYVDDDDPASVEAVTGVGATLLVGPRIVLSEAWNRCYEEARHDVVMHCGDDIIFRTSGWDRLVLEKFDEVPDKIAFVHGRDGFQDAALGTHGFVHRRWVETVGYFVPPYFASDYNDLWLTEVADALGRRYYLPELYTEHMHPVIGKGPLDRTHQERIARHSAEDCDRTWRETAPLREADVRKLRDAIEAYSRESVA